MALDTMVCPFCGEDIPLASPSCRYCRRALDGSGDPVGPRRPVPGPRARPASTPTPEPLEWLYSGTATSRKVGAVMVLVGGAIIIGLFTVIVRGIANAKPHRGGSVNYVPPTPEQSRWLRDQQQRADEFERDRAAWEYRRQRRP